MGIAVLVSLAGFAVTMAGVLLFMPGAPVVPVLSAGDPPGLIVTFLGAAWSLLGAIQFLRHGSGLLAKGFLGLLCAVTLLGTAGNAFWVVKLSYDVPAPVDLPAAKPIPAFELSDQNGNRVSDATPRGKPVVLVFARGTW